MKILNFGSLNIDRVYNVKRFVQPGETIPAAAYHEFAGGKGLNQSIALARAGAEVYHAGKIGEDGLFLKQLLIDNGVDVSLIRTSGGPTGHAVIQVERSGENAIILFGGANQEIGEEEIEACLGIAAAGDWLLLQNEINGLAKIMSLAAEKGLNVAFNPAPMTPDVLDLPIKTVKLLIVNEVEGEMIAGQSDPEKIIEAIAAKYQDLALILTLGEAGAHFVDKTERLFVPAEPVAAVDATGAGDTFIGYFIAETINGSNAADSMAMAAKAAAVCVAREGAAVSIPLRDELV